MSSWVWLKRHAKAVLVGAGSLLLVILTGGWWLRRKNRKIAQALDRVTVSKARARAKALEQWRNSVDAEVQNRDVVIEKIDQRIKDHRREVLERAGVGKGLSDAELESKFKELLG